MKSNSKINVIPSFMFNAGIAVLLLFSSNLFSDDTKLLDEFIQSKGYNNPIVFDSSNIKQYWTDNTVASHDNQIKIHSNDNTLQNGSIPLNISLVNVEENMDCTIEVITKDPSVSFKVYDLNNTLISSSDQEEDFVDYKVVSSKFHLSETPFLSYKLYLKFFSQKTNIISANRIILSFSRNKDFELLTSPGEIKYNSGTLECKNGKIDLSKSKDDSIVVSGKRYGLYSKKKILVADKTLTSSVRIKNIGEIPTVVYLGYAPYTQDYCRISSKNNLYDNKNDVFEVVSCQDNKIVVNGNPSWKKGCFVALNAKEDFSDFPNTSLIESPIQEVKTLSENSSEIVFDKQIKQSLKAGTKIRIQSPDGATYIYVKSQSIAPGEEIEWTTSIEKDDTVHSYNPSIFCKGTYYVIPLIYSFAADTTKENILLISDFNVQY